MVVASAAAATLGFAKLISAAGTRVSPRIPVMHEKGSPGIGSGNSAITQLHSVGLSKK
jgi:hypothetical protein